MPAVCGGNEIEVLVCDEHPQARFGLKMILSQDPGISVVAEAADERQALRRVAERHADVILLEAGLAELIPDLGKVAASPPCSVVYGIEDMSPERLADLVRGNVQGVLHRDASHEDLIRSVHAVTSGGGFASPQLTGPLLQAIRIGTARPGVGHQFWDRLTERENGVLSLLCQGLSNKAIAAALSVSEKTVKFHVSNVLAKSGVSTRAQLIAAVGPGMAFPQDNAVGRRSA